MADATRTSWNHVWVKDENGNERVCNVSSRGARRIDETGCIDDADRPVPLGD